MTNNQYKNLPWENNPSQVITPKMGEGLRKKMKEHNLDAKQLSETSKVYQESIEQITSGKRLISIGEAKKIARALHCSAQEIIHGT